MQASGFRLVTLQTDVTEHLSMWPPCEAASCFGPCVSNVACCEPVSPSPAAASLVFRFLLLASARGHEFEEECRPQCAEVDGQIGHRSC